MTRATVSRLPAICDTKLTLFGLVGGGEGKGAACHRLLPGLLGSGLSTVSD